MRFGLVIVFVRSPDPVNTLCRVGVWAIPPYWLALAFAFSLAFARIVSFVLALAFAFLHTGVSLCDVGRPAVPFWNLDIRHDEDTFNVYEIVNVLNQCGDADGDDSI